MQFVHITTSRVILFLPSKYISDSFKQWKIVEKFSDHIVAMIETSSTSLTHRVPHQNTVSLYETLNTFPVLDELCDE